MPNYGLMTEMANGIKEGMLAYQTAKQIQRQEEMQNLLQGTQRNAQTGLLEFTPEMKAQKENAAKIQQAQLAEYEPGSAGKVMQGLLPTEVVGQDTSLHHVKEFMPLYQQKMKDLNPDELDQELKKARIEALRKGPQGYGSPANIDMRGQKNAFTMHEAATKNVTGDPYTKQLLTSYQNLDNALSNFEKGGKNPQEFHELQQAVRSNLGIKGASIGSERLQTQMHSLGIKANELQQFLTGEPQSVEELSPKMVEVIRSIVENEKLNKRNQALSQIEKARKAQDAIYQSGLMQQYGKQYQPAYEQAIEQLKNQFGAMPPQAGQGLIAPQGQAAPALTPVELKYAQDHGLTPEQALKLKQMRGGQ